MYSSPSRYLPKRGSSSYVNPPPSAITHSTSYLPPHSSLSRSSNLGASLSSASYSSPVSSVSPINCIPMPRWRNSSDKYGITNRFLGRGNLVVAPTKSTLISTNQVPNVVVVQEIDVNKNQVMVGDQSMESYMVPIDFLEPLLLENGMNWYAQMNRDALSGSVPSYTTRAVPSSATLSVPSSTTRSVPSSSTDFFQPNDRVQNLFEIKNGTIVGKTGDNMFNVRYDDGSQANENQSILMKI